MATDSMSDSIQVQPFITGSGLSLLVSPETYAGARRRAALPSFSSCIDALRRSVQSLEDAALQPCASPAGWFHDYFCPEHGHPLHFDPRTPTDHRCASGAGHRVIGAKFDSAWRWFVNDHLSRKAYQCALLWLLTDDLVARDHTREVLLAYAARYPAYAIDSGRSGRATAQSLDEAVWLVPLLWAYGLIRDHLTADEIVTIESQLLNPARDHIASRLWGKVHNIECWHHTALLTAGVVLQRADWAEEATRGILAQLNEGVHDDGFWFEGSPSYHYYAAWALTWSARVSAGVRAHPKLRRMFRAPLDLAFPDGTLPAFNDCWFHSSLRGELVHGAPPADSFYEVATGWFGDPAFALVLAKAYEERPRSCVEALLYGPERLPQIAEKDYPRRSRAFVSTGCAVLAGAGESSQLTQLVFKFGPHGGRHGHPDKLSFALWGFGQAISQDLGTAGYGDAEGTKWYRSTLAHNTVVVDGQSQPPATGRLREFRASEDSEFGVLDGEVDWNDGPYAGVKMRRVLLHRGAVLIDIVDCTGGLDRRFELAQRFAGQFADTQARGEAVPYAAPLRNVCRLSPGLTQQVEIATTPTLITSYFILDSSECLIGDAPTNPRTAVEPIILRSLRGVTARFVSVIHLRASDAPRLSVTSRVGEQGRLLLHIHDGRQSETWTVQLESRLQVELLVEPDTQCATAHSPTGPGSVPPRDHDSGLRPSKESTSSEFCSPGPPLVAFLPQHHDKHYIGLLRDALRAAAVDVRDLPKELTSDWLRANAGPGRVLHFHMPAYDYSRGATTREQVARRLGNWESAISQARAIGYGVVWTAHNLYPHDAPYLDLHHHARLVLLRNATAVIVHCGHAAEELRRRFATTVDMTVIRHPHFRESYDSPWSREEARVHLELPQDGLVYLSLGMIRPYKGQEDLIRAFSALEDPKARLLIVGSAMGAFNVGNQELTRRICNAALADQRIIVRPQHVPDALIPAYYSACDFVVFSYKDILTSGGLVMAQTMERPVIAPSLGCLPDIVPEGTGILYDPNADTALLSALRDARKLAPSAGLDAWKSTRQFNWTRAAAETCEVYRRAVRVAAISTPG